MACIMALIYAIAMFMAQLPKRPELEKTGKNPPPRFDHFEPYISADIRESGLLCTKVALTP